MWMPQSHFQIDNSIHSFSQWPMNLDYLNLAAAQGPTIRKETFIITIIRYDSLKGTFSAKSL